MDVTGQGQEGAWGEHRSPLFGGQPHLKELVLAIEELSALGACPGLLARGYRGNDRRDGGFVQRRARLHDDRGLLDGRDCRRGWRLLRMGWLPHRAMGRAQDADHEGSRHHD